MPVPDYESLMLPILHYMSDGKVRTKGEIADGVANRLKLSNAERAEVLPSGVNTLYNRVHWASYYMFRAGLLSRPQRAHYAISERGKGVFSEHRDQINSEFFATFPEFKTWQELSRAGAVRSSGGAVKEEPSAITPEDSIEQGFSAIRQTLESELLDLVKSCSPRFFERLVVELLLKMGYGGTLPESGQVIGRSGDGGIDGVIKEDKLGLDVIYVQAKRWETSVGRPLVQAFAGSMLGHGVKKGVMITTSQFSSDAREYVKTTGEQKIVLIDGDELARLMIDHDIGVSTVNTYSTKKIDSDYFEEE